MNKSSNYEERLSAAMMRKNSFMSSTKWLYVFSVIRNQPISYHAKVKLLLDDQERAFHIPEPKDFINDQYLEESWGVFEMREIEWISIPAQIVYERMNRTEALTPRVEKQDLTCLQNLLEAVKKVAYELTETALVIYGYR